jgi:hypothetical protein
VGQRPLLGHGPNLQFTTKSFNLMAAYLPLSTALSMGQVTAHADQLMSPRKRLLGQRVSRIIFGQLQTTWHVRAVSSVHVLRKNLCLGNALVPETN